ncbi:hypothetical protein A6S26_13310 [Nostoc sp. ATCC 43529]|nr:hypothetical protein A6S26_13310 [Nostoc sp. ATCC 43529]
MVMCFYSYFRLIKPSVGTDVPLQRTALDENICKFPLSIFSSFLVIKLIIFLDKYIDYTIMQRFPHFSNEKDTQKVLIYFLNNLILFR